MSRGETIALVLGGTALVGGAAYLMLRKPVATSPSKSTALAPNVGTGIVSLFGGLGAGLVNLFNGSSSTPTTAAISNQPLPSLVASQGWTGQTSATGAVTNSLGDSAAPTDPGMSGPTASEISLGITGADYY